MCTRTRGVHGARVISDKEEGLRTDGEVLRRHLQQRLAI